MKRPLACALFALGACGPGTTDTPDAQVYPPATRVFIAGSLDHRVHVFDLETLERVTSIAVPSGPTELHATPDGRLVWALTREGAAVVIIDTATLSVRHQVQVGARPTHSFIDPSYERIWVGNDGSGDVSRIELRGGAETRVLTGNGHKKMAIVTDQDGALRFVYVSNIADSTISVLDPAASLVTNVEVGLSPHGMDYSSVTGRVYNCSGDEENSVEVMSPDADHAVVSRIPLPGRCGYIHVQPDGRAAYATIGTENRLVRIDLEAETVEAFRAGEFPDKFELAGERAFVSNVTEPTVSVVDLRDPTAEPRSIAIGAAVVHGNHGHRGMRLFGDRVFVPNEADHTVSVIDVETEAVIATLDGVMGPSGIAIAGAGVGTTYPR